MITNEDVQNLANLARIEVKDDEMESIRQKMEGILDYVSEVQNLSKEGTSEDDAPDAGENRNVLREDADPHEGEKYTSNIMRNAPDKEENYIKVKKIL